MSYLLGGIQQKFQQIFEENNIGLVVKSNYLIAEDSYNHTIEKIISVVESGGFCPLMSENKMDYNFVFTVTPYKIPDFFRQIETIETSLVVNPSDEERNSYFTKEEVSRLFALKTYVSSLEDDGGDRWSGINRYRSLVSTALNKALSEIILQHAKDQELIVEIGSGTGYSLCETLRAKTIRTQPNRLECQLLSKSLSETVYQMDIESIFNCLKRAGKKIPLFFGINVFDTLSPALRKASFSQLSQLQNTDDHILIMLDTNPYLNRIIEDLESMYPGHAILPYYPLKNEPAPFSVIIVPLEYVGCKLSIPELLEVIKIETSKLVRGQPPTEMQMNLHELQMKWDLKVIVLEDFFAEQVKNELREMGYEADSHYLASFIKGALPDWIEISTDLIYKSVTDISPVRQWNLTDEKLPMCLAKKDVKLAIESNEDFVHSTHEKGQKIIAAEVLVIEARKL